MALSDENGMVMPVTPMYGGGYGNNGGGLFGGGDSWLGILFLIALLNGGWGGFGGFGGGMMGGFGNMALGYDFPWLLNGQQQISNNTNNGFRDAMINDGITSIRDGISSLSTQLCGCCGDMQMSLANGFASTNLGIANGTAAIQNSLCNGFNGVNTAISGAQNALTQQLYSNELASLNRSFAEQTANTQGFTNVNTGVADLKYTVATEACADRNAISSALRDVLAANTASTQRILDQMCQDKIDAKNDTIAQLRQELMYSRGQASQTEQTAALLANNNAQTALFQQGLNNEVDALYNRLSSCPVPSVPVYGRQPIFTCNNNNSCGCGCGGNNF